MTNVVDSHTLEPVALLLTLEGMLQSERQGNGLHVEGQLKQILLMQGFHQGSNDVLWGFSIEQENRRRWQRLGYDPDSANEVDECANIHFPHRRFMR